MTKSSGSALGWGKIIAIMLVYGVGMGAFLGLYGERLGLSSGVRAVLISVTVSMLAVVLLRRRQAALGQQHKG